MTEDLAKHYLDEIDSRLAMGQGVLARPVFSDYRDRRAEVSEFVVGSVATIHRVSGDNSQYSKTIDGYVAQSKPRVLYQLLPDVVGTLKALRRDVESGYLVRFEELVHADLFSDFLEMAQYLLEEGYKDPAAVLVGGVLEGQLRALCEKNIIETETMNSRGQVHSKKAQIMNQDLAKEKVYGKLDQKSVTAWLDLRNKASHGLYDEYFKEQVELLLSSVRDFLVRYPA